MTATGWVIVFGAVGLLNCFAGYRVFLFTLVALGAALGATVGYSLGEAVSPGTPALIGAVLGAILLGWLSIAAYFLGIALLGAFLLGTAASMVFGTAGTVTHLIAVVVAGILGAALAVLLQRTVLIIGTAIQGGLAVVVAGVVLLGHGTVADFQRLYGEIVAGSARPSEALGHWTLVGLWAVLALGGMLVQFPRARRLEERREQRRLELP